MIILLYYTGTSSGSESAQSTVFESLPVTASISAVIALIVGLVIGCLFGACFVYMCMKRKTPKLSRLDTITQQNMGAIDASSKYLTMNSAYGSKDTATGQDVIDINGSSKTEEAPQYEDMDEVRKAYHENKDEFELSENNAYSRMEDITDSFYDN